MAKKKINKKLPKAKAGYWLQVDPKKLAYEDLPCVGCKDKLMAEYGMYMDPGPRMPNLGQSVSDYYGGYPERDLPSSRVQGPVPIGTPPDTSKVKPGNFLGPKDLQSPKGSQQRQGQHNSFNPGNIALGALTAFDALLPNRVSKQQVVQPQMSYNPMPYGYGSQALMEHGGFIPKANYGYYVGEDENNSPSAKNGKTMKSKKKLKKYDDGGAAPALFGLMNTFSNELGGGKQGLMSSFSGGQAIPMALGGTLEDKLMEAKDGHWIQKAVNPAHKGYCTPMTKSTCTPRRKALAKTFKKMARNRKKDEGGFIQPGWDQYDGGGIIPDNMSAFNPHRYEQGGDVNGGAKIRMVDGKYPNTDLMEQWLLYEQGGNVNGGAKLKEVGATYPNSDMLEQWLLYAHGGNVNGGANIREVGAHYPNTDLMEQWLLYENGGIMPGMHKKPDGSWIPNHMMQMAQGGDLSSDKAKEMLRDGTAHGKKLTKKQKQYFGMVAAGKAAMGTEIGFTGPESGDPKPKIPTDGRINWDARRLKGSGIDQDALLADQIQSILGPGYDPYNKEGRAALNSIQDTGFANQVGVRINQLRSDPSYASMTPEQRINTFYQSGATGTTNLDQFIRRTKSLGGSPGSYWQNHPGNTNRVIPSSNFKDGGIMYDDGGKVETMWGGNANMESYNPYDGGTIEFNGDSHAQGGIGMAYNGNPVEVEGGEYASKDGDGNLTIYGNMSIPGTKTKFKKAASAIADREKRYDRLVTKGSDLVNGNNPANRFEQLKFNAGKVMMQGGQMGMADLATKKEKLASLQRAMLDMAEEHGLDPNAMSQGKMKKAKGGASIPFYQDGGNLGGNDPTRADRNMNPGNIKYGKFAKKYGAKKDKDGFAIFPDKQTGLKAMKELLASDSYVNMPVKDAIKKWTDNKPYRYQLGELADKKVSDLGYGEFEKVISAMTKGEGTRYGSGPTPKPLPTPQGNIPKVPDPGPFTPYRIPEMSVTPEVPQIKPVNPVSPYDQLEVPERRPIRSNVEPLHANQLLGEMYAAATNKVEPVPTQRYEPQLYTPYQVSFQDRLNQNQSAFNAQMRGVGPYNPAAIGTLAAQKYQADQAVLGDQFRTNQSIANDITNKNIATVNDANLKNLGLADTQMVRQSQARSNTKALNQTILNSISSKYAQNDLQNKRLAAYENLYDYRFVPQDDGGLSATYFGPNAMFNYNGRNTTGQKPQDVRTISRYDAAGNLRGYNEYDESDLKEMQRRLDIETKRRKEPLLELAPLK